MLFKTDIAIFLQNRFDTLVYCTALGFPNSNGVIIFVVNCSMPLLHARQQTLASVSFYLVISFAMLQGSEIHKLAIFFSVSFC